MPSHDNANFFGFNITACCMDAFDLAVLNIKARDFTVLNDVDTARIRSTCQSPCNGVMAGRAAAALQR